MAQRILVVDDDAGLRSLLRVIFMREGFEVIEATDGEEAVDRAQLCNPAVILLDVMMPRMDGFEACRRLRADARTSRMPVLFVSAVEDAAGRATAQQIGADDWITKPIGPRELVNRVRVVMERRGVGWAR